MVQIKNGKIRIGGVSFSLPDGFFIERVDENACSFRLENILLQMGVEESTLPVKDVLLDDANAPSGILDVTRAGMQGKAVFSYASEIGVRCYEERFALKDGKQFFALVEVYGENALSKEQMQTLIDSVL